MRDYVTVYCPCYVITYSRIRASDDGVVSVAALDPHRELGGIGDVVGERAADEAFEIADDFVALLVLLDIPAKESRDRDRRAAVVARVVASSAGDGVVAVGIAHRDEVIVSIAAKEQVISRAANDVVVVISSEAIVVTISAVDEILPIPAGKNVSPVTTFNPRARWDRSEDHRIVPAQRLDRHRLHRRPLVVDDLAVEVHAQHVLAGC